MTVTAADLSDDERDAFLRVAALVKEKFLDPMPDEQVAKVMEEEGWPEDKRVRWWGKRARILDVSRVLVYLGGNLE